MSEETKAKLRLAMTGKKHSEETLVKLRKAMTGKTQTPDAILRMRESLRKTWDAKLGRKTESLIPVVIEVAQPTKRSRSRK